MQSVAEKILFLPPMMQKYYRDRIALFQLIDHPIEALFIENIRNETRMYTICPLKDNQYNRHHISYIPIDFKAICDEHESSYNLSVIDYYNTDVIFLSYANIFMSLSYMLKHNKYEYIIMRSLISFKQFSRDDINKIIEFNEIYTGFFVDV